jgi:hypothetical protein
MHTLNSDCDVSAEPVASVAPMLRIRLVDPRIALAAHAVVHSVSLQQVGVIVAGILAAAIGVMHQTWLDASL